MKNKKVLSNYSNALSQLTIFSWLELIEKIRNDNIRYTINLEFGRMNFFKIWKSATTFCKKIIKRCKACLLIKSVSFIFSFAITEINRIIVQN